MEGTHPNPEGEQDPMGFALRERNRQHHYNAQPITPWPAPPNPETRADARDAPHEQKRCDLHARCLSKVPCAQPIAQHGREAESTHHAGKDYENGERAD
jgi:hypothetical protein